MIYPHPAVLGLPLYAEANVAKKHTQSDPDRPLDQKRAWVTHQCPRHLYYRYEASSVMYSLVKWALFVH